MIQIVHISDFHLDSKPISYKKGQLVNALVVDLEKQISEPEKCIFVISGDLMDKVGDNFECPQEGFTYFKEVFIDTIKNALGISYDQFFFVPGNHDVDRKKVDSIIENGILATVSTVEGINKFIVENKSYSRYLERLEDFKLFEENFYKDAELAKQMTNFDSCFITENNIGIACLNSSWRSSKANEDGSLIVGEKQVESAQSFLKGTDIRIAIMHHPLDDLLKEDKDKIKPILYKYFDVLLIGHKHHVDMEYTRNFHGTLLNCQSNASLADFSDASYNNGYSIINFTKNRNTRIQYRKYLSDYEVFVANTDVGTEDGCIIIPYPDENQIAKTTIVDKALNTLENVRFDNVDEHLFTYGLDPKIPCKINDLFVEPTLSNIPETHSTPDEIIYYHLTDIINGTDNYLIYGLKESGKSTLLNKLMVEFTLSYKHAEYIPINIAYNELATRSISQIIRDYLSISSEECRSLLAQNKLVLLIDDINFEGDEKLTKITDFVQQYPNNKIIATREQVLENVLPTEFLEYNGIFNFNIAYIQNFKTQQIKSLIKKWFPEQTDDYKKRINSLIKNFEALSLPRTPLAVTLFLWIIDKQEKNPINNSILVQQVVENLLEKAHFENVYQNKFTYQNKIRLLAYIAKEMEEKGDENFSYRIKYTHLLEFIDAYLIGKSDLNSKKIVDDLIRRGILAYHNDEYIKFKFDFLYRYFLALLIGYDEEFRNAVLVSENCLNYFDELIYYSGLYPDNKELLRLSQGMLLSAFADYNQDVLQNWAKLDPFLNSRNAISNGLSMKTIQKKPTEKELEKIYDEELKNIPIKRTIEKREKVHNWPLDKTLKFAALVFRNLEEVDNQQERSKALQSIITSSISLLLYVRDAWVYNYIKNHSAPKGFPKNIDFALFIRLMPLLHQVVVSDWIGTEKTKLVIQEKIESHPYTANISEYEKFMDIFTYADVKGKDSFDIVRSFLKNNKFKYIKDLGIIKLILYYYMRSKSKESDAKYLNLISDLKIQLKQVKDKGTFMKQISDGRNIEMRKNNKG